MQNSNEIRVLPNYPDYKIHKYGSVYKVKNGNEVKTLNKPNEKGLTLIKLKKNGVSHQETLQDLLDSVFTVEEIFGNFQETPYQRFEKELTNKEKFINKWIEKYYHEDADDEYGNLDYVRAEAQREYEPIELDEWAGDQMEQYERDNYY